MKSNGPDVLSRGLIDIRREIVRVFAEASGLTFYDVSFASLLLRSAGEVSRPMFFPPSHLSRQVYTPISILISRLGSRRRPRQSREKIRRGGIMPIDIRTYIYIRRYIRTHTYDEKIFKTFRYIFTILKKQSPP